MNAVKQILVAGLCALSASFALPAQAQQADPQSQPDCLQLTPGAVAITNAPVTLNLRVVMDGVDVGRAQQVLADALAAYSPLAIQINASYQYVSFTSTDATALIAEAKSHFGGNRPAGSDAVYVITSKDLITNGNDNSIVGQADCIGGVAHANTAFAVGEALEDSPLNAAVVALYRKNAAKVLAHELGHLLGAQHHYANCAEAAAGGDAPCTLLFNDLSLQSLKFSTLNSSVVRGAAQQFAGSGGTVVNTGATGAGSGGSGSASGSAQGSGGGGAMSWLALLPLALLRLRRPLQAKA